LKKILLSIIGALLFSTMLAGCKSVSPQQSQENSQPPTMAAATAASITEPAAENTSAPKIRLIEPAEGVYVYDNAGILSKDTVSKCNDYAEWASKTYGLNIGVVTTDNIGSLTPKDFARVNFEHIYPTVDNGLLVLINNATFDDYVYRKGIAETYISDTDVTAAMLKATRKIANGDFESAIIELMMLSENCPD